MDAASDHGWETWTWDASLFEGAARHYRRGRTPYAPGLDEALRRALDLDGRGRLLDVGCGPGSVTLLFAGLFDAVVGVDPDEAMLDEAHRAAVAAGVGNATWVRLRAEQLPEALGTFRVVTFAHSFHWMDRHRVAASVRTMLEPGGSVVQVDHVGHPLSDLARRGPHPPVPVEAIEELRVGWLGPARRAGKGLRTSSPSGEDDVFQQAGFAPERIVLVPDDRVLARTSDDVVAWVFSMSSTAPHLFGDRLAAFESELRAVLAAAAPAGRFSVPLSDNRLRIRQPS